MTSDVNRPKIHIPSSQFRREANAIIVNDKAEEKLRKWGNNNKVERYTMNVGSQFLSLCKIFPGDMIYDK